MAVELAKPPYEQQAVNPGQYFTFGWTQWFQSLFASILRLDSGLNQGRHL